MPDSRATAPNHVLYDNEVLENKITDISNSSLDVFPLMTLDTSLTSNAGTKKTINVYKYTGSSQTLGRGEGNTNDGVVSFTPEEHIVKLNQQRFAYFDEDVMQDPLVVDVGTKGMGQSIGNEIRNEFFKEVAKTTTVSEYTSALTYDAVVDGISKLNTEDEAGLFLLINNAGHKAELRKDPDFKGVNQGSIIVNGHIGYVSGIPVIASKLVVDPIIATKEAVTCFVKKSSEIEQERCPNIRKNTIYARRVNLIALTDMTKACKLTKVVVPEEQTTPEGQANTEVKLKNAK